MGARGPVRRVALRAVEGETSTVPEVPGWLSVEAKAEYSRVGRAIVERGTGLGDADVAVLAVYADSVVRWREQLALLDEEGEMVTTANGMQVMNQRGNWVSQYRNAVMETAKRLGLSPADRARIGDEVKAEAGSALLAAIVEKKEKKRG